MKEEKEPTLRDSFEELKKMASAWGASVAEIKTNDGKWQYTMSVKRLNE